MGIIIDQEYPREELTTFRVDIDFLGTNQIRR